MKKVLFIILITIMGCSQKKITAPTCQPIADKIEKITVRDKTNRIGS